MRSKAWLVGLAANIYLTLVEGPVSIPSHLRSEVLEFTGTTLAGIILR